MTEVDRPYAQGTPCWLDLLAKDQQAAMDFYSNLFGWTGERGPEEFGGYAMMMQRDKPVAGIGVASAPEGEPAPPHAWTTHLAADNADETAKRIVEAGGTLMIEPLDLGATGRMGIASDPTGAVFGFWQHGDFFGAELVKEPGALTWNECNTRDLPAASDFYRDAFGVTVEPLEGSKTYAAVKVADATVAGLQDISALYPEGVPAHWLAWFAVDDVDATAKKAKKLGGSITMKPTNAAPGRLASIADPWGAMFCVLKPGGK
jgi:uncharacterized protein